MTTAYNFFPSNREEVVKKLGKEALIENLRKMLLIRNFERERERYGQNSAYQQGKIGGFFHAYIGQEAVQLRLCRRWDNRIGGRRLMD